MPPRQFDMVADAARPQPTLPAVTAVDLDILASCWCRLPVFFRECRDHMRPELFDPQSESHYWLLFTTLLRLDDKQVPFTITSILPELHGRFTHEGLHIVTPDQRMSLLRQDNDGIVYGAFLLPDSQYNLQLARHFLQKFLRERAVVNPLRRHFLQGNNGGHVENLQQVLDAAETQLMRLSAMSNPLPGPLMPNVGEVLAPPSVYEQIGVGFMDKALGGQRRGDHNGIMGPFGGGKSTLAAQIVCSGARLEVVEARAQGRVPRWSVLMTYEESKEKAWPRLVSQATKIRREKLEAWGGWHTLTTPANMEPYELALTQTSGVQMSELQRYQANQDWVNQGIMVFDMSGMPGAGGGGMGGVPELAGCLRRLVDETGRGIRVVVIDYAELACRKYMQAKNMAEDRLRHLLTAWGDDVRMRAAVPLDTTIWSLQQVSGEANRFHPAKLMRIADAKESKSFAENLAVCGCIGVEDPKTGCRYVNWDKLRYRGKATAPPSLVRVHPQWAELIDVSDQYQLDDVGHEFVERAAARRLHGGPPQLPVAENAGFRPAGG